MTEFPENELKEQREPGEQKKRRFFPFVIIAILAIIGVLIGHFIGTQKEHKRVKIGVTGEEALKGIPDANAKKIARLLNRVNADKDSSDARFELANAYMEIGDYESAALEYKKVSELDPKNTKVLTALGSAYEKQGLLDEAIGAYKKAIELEPENTDAYFKLGSAYKKAGKEEEAIKEIGTQEGGKAPEPSSLVAFYSGLGKKEEIPEEIRKAVPETTETPETTPKTPEKETPTQLPEEITVTTETELQPTEPAEAPAVPDTPTAPSAESSVEQAQPLDSEGGPLDEMESSPDAMDHLLQGATFEEQKNFQGAIDEYNKALSIDPNVLEAYRGLARVFLELNQPQEALKALGIVVEKDKTDYNSLLKMGEIYEKSGQKGNAAAAYEAVLFLIPSDKDLWLKTAKLYIEAGNIQKAIEVYENAIKAMPNFVDAYVDLIDIYRDQGNDQKELEKLFQLSDHVQGESSAFVKYAIGNVYRKQGNLPEAIKYYNDAIVANSKYLDAYVALGEALFKDGQYPQAETAYETAIGLSEGDALLHYNLGFVYASQNKIEDAIQQYEKLLSIDQPDLAAKLLAVIEKVAPPEAPGEPKEPKPTLEPAAPPPVTPVVEPAKEEEEEEEEEEQGGGKGKGTDKKEEKEEKEKKEKDEDTGLDKEEGTE